MTDKNALENRIKADEKNGFIDKVLDASSTAIGTSVGLSTWLSGAPAGAVALGYLLPYAILKTGKYLSNIVRKPYQALSLGGVGNALYDTVSHVVPLGKNKVPAGVGAMAVGTNYLGRMLQSYLI